MNNIRNIEVMKYLYLSQIQILEIMIVEVQVESRIDIDSPGLALLYKYKTIPILYSHTYCQHVELMSRLHT